MRKWWNNNNLVRFLIFTGLQSGTLVWHLSVPQCYRFNCPVLVLCTVHLVQNGPLKSNNFEEMVEYSHTASTEIIKPFCWKIFIGEQEGTTQRRDYKPTISCLNISSHFKLLAVSGYRLPSYLHEGTGIYLLEHIRKCTANRLESAIIQVQV